MHDLDAYPFEIRPLSAEEGGGFLINYPDFNVCLSDGETIAEAIDNGHDALTATIAALEDMGCEIPAPGSAKGVHDRFVHQLPRELRTPLEKRARVQGQSPATLINDLLAAQLMARHTPR